MSWRCVGLPISLRLSSRSSAKMSLRSSSMGYPSGASFSCARGGGENGVDDRLVAGAAADVAGNRLDHLDPAWRGVAIEERFRGHQHARRAISALGREMLHERRLQRMKLRAGLEAVCGRD